MAARSGAALASYLSGLPADLGAFYMLGSKPLKEVQFEGECFASWVDQFQHRVDGHVG